MPKVIEESGGGFVFNTDEELLHAMDRLIEDPGLRDKLGRQGNAVLLQKWTADVHIPCVHRSCRARVELPETEIGWINDV